MQLRENAPKYDGVGIKIVVIAGQKKESVAKWLSENPMPFPFLIDEDRAVMKAFDVYNRINIDSFRLAHPSLFFIDEHGKVVYSYVSSNQFDRPKDQDVYNEVQQYLIE